MAFSVVTVTHQFLNPDGTFASGSCVFQLTKRMGQPNASVVPGVEVTATLDGTGHVSASLYATQDATTIPQDAQWEVDIRVNNKDDGPYFFPLAASPSTQDLFALLPQDTMGG